VADQEQRLEHLVLGQGGPELGVRRVAHAAVLVPLVARP
jgi:hypothetical protein